MPQSADILEVLEKLKTGSKDLKMDELLLAVVYTNQNVLGQINGLNEKMTAMSAKMEEVLSNGRESEKTMNQFHSDFALMQGKLKEVEVSVEELTDQVSHLQDLKNQGIGIYKFISFVSLVLGVLLSIYTFSGIFKEKEQSGTNTIENADR